MTQTMILVASPNVVFVRNEVPRHNNAEARLDGNGRITDANIVIGLPGRSAFDLSRLDYTTSTKTKALDSILT